MTDKLILAAMLDIDDHDINRRVYSPSGICPTIRAASGGNTEPKVLVSSMPKVMMAGHIEGRSTYARRDWVLSPKGTAPTVLANWGAKSPPPLVAVGKDEPRIIVRGRLHEGGCNMTLRVYDPVGLCPTQWASQGRDPIKVVVPKETYIEIPTWPEYNNQNRVYLRGGICPTLTTQCSHSKPPLVLVEGTK